MNSSAGENSDRETSELLDLFLQVSGALADRATGQSGVDALHRLDDPPDSLVNREIENRGDGLDSSFEFAAADTCDG